MSERLQALISAFLEGALADAERAELNEILRRDPEARAAFAAAMRQETLVGEIRRDAKSTAEAKRPTARRPGRRFRRIEGARSAIPWVAGLAACVLVTLAVLFASKPPAPTPVARTTEEPPLAPPVEVPPAPVPSRSAPKIEPAPTPAPPPSPAPAPLPAPAPERPAPPPPTPEVKPKPAPPTVTFLATVKSVQGEAFTNDRKPIREGDGIVAGQGLEGRAVVVYTDGTRLELDGEARGFSDREGKRLEVAHGTLKADVTKQPAGRPMIVSTPHGDARVLGTSLRLVVNDKTTRLEVRQGKVRLTRLDGKFADVGAGFFAVAATGVEPKARPLPANRALDMDESLIGHWKFDEGRGDTVFDASFAGNDGTVTGATWAQGRSGAALRFDGVDDVAIMNGRFPLPKNALTLAAWVRHESVPGKVQRYLVLRSDVDLAVLRHDGANAPKQLDFFVNASGFQHLRASDALSTGIWLHVAGTWDGKVQRAFLNGAEVARQETAGPLAAREGSSLWVGVAREPMHGMVDDVRVYSRALADREIAELAGRK